MRRQNTSVLAKLGNGDIVRQLILNRFNAYPILSDVFVVLKRIILKLVNNNKGHTKTVLNFIHELFDVDKEVLEKVSTESKNPYIVIFESKRIIETFLLLLVRFLFMDLFRSNWIPNYCIKFCSHLFKNTQYCFIVIIVIPHYSDNIFMRDYEPLEQTLNKEIIHKDNTNKYSYIL